MPPRLLFDLQGKRVFVAGHKGLAGSALLRHLGAKIARFSPSIAAWWI